ncbi:hypothetical protein FNV43_RR04833 [Rhamnella rubrinervis]|uniref:Uncharacterized protein n=1 Tax=Rhamnella rubrinervis TaxID=2594499 RepID=A0A8K0MPY5_9ROSA|nr:hypothetical protein FNV43_RR04833 [Rhamnella rubrinervis]
MTFLMPHELFAFMRLNATTPPPPSEAAESVGSSSTISDDHHEEVSSSSARSAASSSHHKQCRKRSLPWSFEYDQPTAFLVKKHNSLPSPPSSSSTNNLGFVGRKRSPSAAPTATTTAEPAMKKLKSKKDYDLEGILRLPHQIFHYFRTIRGNNAINS